MNCKDAVRVEHQPRKSGGTRTVYTFKCKVEECSSIIKVRSSDLKTSLGLCGSHAHTKRPFESIYNGLHRDWRKLEVELSYEEFLEFTKIKKCHYCYDDIPWEPYGTVNGKFTSRAYYLDRKDNSKGYSRHNCVVCCTGCNNLRGSRFTYEQFLEVAKLIRKWKQNAGVVE